MMLSQVTNVCSKFYSFLVYLFHLFHSSTQTEQDYTKLGSTLPKYGPGEVGL